MSHSLLQRVLAGLDRVQLGRPFAAQRAPAGLLQRWYAAQPTQRIIVAVVELAQRAQEPLLESAVRSLSAHHPHALGVCLVRSTEQLSMRPLTPSDAAPLYVPPDASSDAWTLAEQLVHVPFGAGEPLFRVALADRGKRVVCAFDHIMFDGISAAHFACALARCLAGSPPSAAEPDAHLPLDARIDLRPSAAQLVRALRPRPAPVPPLAAASGAQRWQTKLARHEVESVDCERLRARAHHQGVTLHAALSASALLAAAEALDVRHGRLRLHTPISLRSRCRPEPHGFGVFIGGVDADLDVVAPREVWAVARSYAEALARDKPDAPGQLGLLAFAGDLSERARALEDKQHGRTATLEVSNVGRIQDVPEGTAVWLTQGAHYHAPLLVLTVVESAGVVRACLSYPSPLVDEARAGRFIRAFAKQLAQASRR